MERDPVADFFDPLDGLTTPARVDGRTIPVLFDAAYTDVLGVGSASPAATCSDASLEGVRAGALMTIKGVDYRIDMLEPDGTGVTLARLSRA